MHEKKVGTKARLVETALALFLLGGATAGAQLPEGGGVPLPERERMEEAIAEPSGPPAEAPLRLSGYVDGTYLYNFGPGQATNPLDFPADTVPKGDFNLSALWLRLEKPLVRESAEVNAGFQLGVMLGEDATYYAANPSTTPNGPNSSSLYVAEAIGKIWVPEVQMEVWFGKFQAVIGYETIWRPDNPHITFGIDDAFMPLDNIGFLTIFSPDEFFDIGFGLANTSGEANDTNLETFGDEYSVISYFVVESPAENARLQPGIYVDPWGQHAGNARVAINQDFYYTWNVLGEWSPLNTQGNWTLAFEVTGGSGTGDTSQVADPEPPTTFASGGLYSMWMVTESVSLNGRAEYMHTSNNAFTLSSRTSGGDYWDYTLTVGVKIMDELVWRGEGRYQWGAEMMTPTASGLWTVATEIYYRF
jgi:hypothetical protein